MSFGVTAAVVGGVALGGATLYASSQSSKAAKNAADAQGRAAQNMEDRLTESANEIDVSANKYATELQKLSDSFNPMDFTKAYNSLYDSIIAPMERDFKENTMPALAAAYSGIGGGQNTGAYKETVAKTKQQAAGQKATLRADARDKAYAQNLDEYNRKANVLASTLSADTMAPTVRAQQAPIIYGAQTDSIAATLAAKQQAANIIPNTISAAMSGAFGASQISNSISKGNTQKTVG